MALLILRCISLTMPTQGRCQPVARSPGNLAYFCGQRQQIHHVWCSLQICYRLHLTVVDCWLCSQRKHHSQLRCARLSSVLRGIDGRTWQRYQRFSVRTYMTSCMCDTCRCLAERACGIVLSAGTSDTETGCGYNCLMQDRELQPSQHQGVHTRRLQCVQEQMFAQILMVLTSTWQCPGL